jgi:Protein of unknown function (DUF2934)
VARKSKDQSPLDDNASAPVEPAAETKRVTTKRRSTAGKKTKVTGKTRSSSARAKPTPNHFTAGLSEPTEEEIRTRAYFISERRHRLALPGDASSDWLEAKRQLLSESGRK